MLCCARGRRSRGALFCARGGHVVLCFVREEVMWCSVSRAKEGHMGLDIREREEAENGVGSTANQKTIPPQ
ncbi:hypothetical protein chiPu_0002239 [Chiloscyllium punctatum]|uniref:Uncharacterized protein n=1 Tax=Chiloscyllium punctatum TaxID=137246 RepID=A0A401S0A0_CHIPU|nr:hypothetical protein [Chiloscyllium punctatum]